MTDLLVSSLMADGGLEAALVAAIKVCYILRASFSKYVNVSPLIL